MPLFRWPPKTFPPSLPRHQGTLHHQSPVGDHEGSADAGQDARADVEGGAVSYSRESQTASLGRRTAGYQALIARNEQIRRLKAKGVTEAEIALRFGIGETTVGKIYG